MVLSHLESRCLPIFLICSYSFAMIRLLHHDVASTLRLSVTKSPLDLHFGKSCLSIPSLSLAITLIPSQLISSLSSSPILSKSHNQSLLHHPHLTKDQGKVTVSLSLLSLSFHVSSHRCTLTINVATNRHTMSKIALSSIHFLSI